MKDAHRLPISAGERLYALADFARLINLRACDVVQMDVAHCGGISVAKKIAAMAAAQDMAVSPHCSIGPVAFAAALHFAWSTPNMLMLESFAEFDVDWRNDLVGGWNPLATASFGLPEQPGLGIDTRRGGDRCTSLPAARLPLALGRNLARRIHRHREACQQPLRSDATC